MVNGKVLVPLSFFGRIDVKIQTVPAVAAWRRHEFTFEAPCDNDSAALRVYIQGEEPGNVWIDQLSVTEENSGGPHIQHIDFSGAGAALPPGCKLFTLDSPRTAAEWSYDKEMTTSGKQSLAIKVIKNPDGNTDYYESRLYFEVGRLAMKAGRRYRVAFDLASSRDRYVSFDVLDPGSGKSYLREEDSLFIQQVKLAASHGIHIHHLNLGSVPFLTKDEASTYSSVDRAFAAARQADPKGVFILRFGVIPSPYTGWYQQYPNEQMYPEKGDAFPMVEPCSQAWLAQLEPALGAYIKHIESKWGDCVLLYHPCAYNGGEWNYPGRNEQHDFGFSPAVTEGFRRWLETRYTSIAKLNIAWHKSFAGFAEISIPTFEERQAPTDGEFLHPAKARPLIDFFEFRNDSMAHAIERTGDIIKRASVLNRPVMFFYGYTFEINSSVVEGGHAKWSSLLSSSNADAFCAPTAYFGRNPGEAAYFHAPVDSVAQHGKFWQNEDDVHTSIIPGEKNAWIPKDLEQTMDGHVRNFAHLYVRRMGCWYMDLLGNGWLNDDKLWENIGKLKAFWEKRKDLPCTFAPEIAIIADERSAYYLPFFKNKVPYVDNGSIDGPLLSNLRGAFGRIGAPVGYYLLDDFLAGRVDAKLYVFTNAFALNSQQRSLIHTFLAKRHATALWFYAPGYVDTGKQELSSEAIGDLVGMTVRRQATPVKDMMIRAPRSGASWFAGPFGSGYDKLRDQWYIEPAGVTPLAMYQDAPDKIAAALTEKNAFTSIYVAGLSLPLDFARAIAKHAGVWIYCDSGDTIEADHNLIMIHAASDGEKIIRLKAPAATSDALTGEPISDGSEIHLEMKQGQTRLLWRQ